MTMHWLHDADMEPALRPAPLVVRRRAPRRDASPSPEPRGLQNNVLPASRFFQARPALVDDESVTTARPVSRSVPGRLSRARTSIESYVKRKSFRPSLGRVIERAGIESLEARNREAVVRIADKKAELQYLDSQIHQTTTKGRLLVQPDDELSGPFVDHHCPQDSSTGRQSDDDDNDSDSTDDLPDVLFPPFDFDGEFEGTFRQPHCYTASRSSGVCGRSSWSAVCRREDSIDSDCYPDLTEDDSSGSDATSIVFVDLQEGNGLDHFPRPPARSSAFSWHRRDWSDASEYGVAAVLEAKQLFFAQNSSKALAIVQIPAASNRKANNAAYRMPTEPSRYHQSKRKTDQSHTTARHGHSKHVETVMQYSDMTELSSRAHQPPLRYFPRDLGTRQRPSVHARKASQYSIHVESQSKPRRSQNTLLVKPSEQPWTGWANDPAAFENVLPRKSSLNHDMHYVARSSQSRNGRAYFDARAYPGSGQVRPALPPSGRIASPVAFAKVNHHESQTLSRTPSPEKGRRSNRSHKLKERLSLDSGPKRSGARRLRAFLRPFPFTRHWWRARSSTLTDLSVMGANAPNSAPPQLMSRTSLGLPFERVLMTELERPSFGRRKSSITTMSSRTIRTMHSASRSSSRVHGSSIDSGKVSDRYCLRKHITALDFPSEEPHERIIQAFIERPAGHRRLPSLAELP